MRWDGVEWDETVLTTTFPWDGDLRFPVGKPRVFENDGFRTEPSLNWFRRRELKRLRILAKRLNDEQGITMNNVSK